MQAIRQQEEKSRKISLFGVGRLGLAYALALEEVGMDVLGVDVDSPKVDLLNQKITSSEEPEVKNLLKTSTKIQFTTEAQEAVKFASTIFIFVQTPSTKNGNYDHSQVENVIESIVQSNSDRKALHIVISCTVMPGYCDELSKRLEGKNLRISYHPQFIAFGSIIEDLRKPNMLILGEESSHEGEDIAQLCRAICRNSANLHQMDRKSAELTKLAANCAFTTKIALANSLGDIAVAAGLSPEPILRAIASDDRIGPKGFKYGFGFGGPCFPRDNRALQTLCADLSLKLPLSEATEQSNQEHLHFQTKHFVENNPDKAKVVHVEGVTYKPGALSLENSQQLAFAVNLKNLGYPVVLHDSEAALQLVKEIHGNDFSYEAN